MGTHYGVRPNGNGVFVPRNGIAPFGLQLYLDAGDTESYSGTGTIWYDLSNDNNANLVNGPTYNSEKDGSIVFDGTNDYANLTFNPPLTNQMSLEVWVELSTPTSQYGWISGREGSYRLLYTTSLFEWVCATDNNGWYTAGTDIAATGLTPTSSIYHIVGTYDGTNNKLYVNGSLVTTGANISGNIKNLGTYSIMQDNSGTTDISNGAGKLYTHMIYNRALSAAEVSSNYSALVSRYTNLVLDGLILYLDGKNPSSYSGSGTTWTDLSGSGYNGTIVGSPVFTDGYFDITSDSTYISIPNAGLSPRTNDFTYSCWVKFDAFEGYDTIFENGAWTDVLLFRLQNGNTMYVYAEGGLRGTYSWSPAINTWYNIVLRRQSNTTSMYINTVLTGTPFTMTTDINLANPNLWLMRSQHTTGQFTNGKISNFLIYNRALTEQEITTNYDTFSVLF